MADLEAHYSALDRCRTAIGAAAGNYLATLVDRNPGEITYDDAGELRNNRTPVKAETFGDLAESGGLATAANDVWDAILGEMDQARRKLADTERALNTVEENLRAAHRATS
ncbi:hypothetical protein [Nonomuraea candida]|uniref:hypothetical protein n=1 Tax=Nonomuraea candida TaxID=359159 RepID=UPI0005BA792B|nr:hypothetical protein [Nonomuraea candida]